MTQSDPRGPVVEHCLKLIEAPVEYEHQMPCPDGIDGCLMSHTVTWKRAKTAQEIASDVRIYMNMLQTELPY